MQSFEDVEADMQICDRFCANCMTWCGLFSYRFTFRVLETFQGAIMFILALQANNMILKLIDDGVFQFVQLLVVLLFVILSILISVLKDKFISSYELITGTNSPSIMNTKSGFLSFAHAMHTK